MQEIPGGEESEEPAGRQAPSEAESGAAADGRRQRLAQIARSDSSRGELRLRRGLRVEELDGELVVLDSSAEVVHRVTGVGVAAVRLVEAGVATSEVPEALLESIEALSAAGLLAGPRRMSRRSALAAGGATWAAATVTTFALADPAAAWSTCRNGKVPTAPDAGSTGKKYTTAGTHTWVSGPSGFHTPNTQRSYNVLVRAWGGGGSGGSDGGTYGGGGGGGGAYVDANISVLECTEHTIVVGAGGTGSSAAGGASTFKDATTLRAAPGAGGGNASFGSGGGGGAGGSVASSVPASGNRRAGGNGGGGGSYSDTACGGGSGGSTGAGGNGSGSAAGNAGSGNPGGAKGGVEETAGVAPGGGGGGDGGNGAPGAVWVGV